MSTKTSRCRILGLLLVGVITLGFSSFAQAQLHGASIAKGCLEPVRACETDDECDDGNQCTTNICDTSNSLTEVTCTVEIVNIDGWGDTISIRSLQDVLAAPGGDETTPSTAMDIIPLQGATCAGSSPNWELPCELPAADGPTPAGKVQFTFASYNPTVLDVDSSPLSDQATGIYWDRCDDPGTVGCSKETDKTLQAGASAIIETGCIPGDPVDCDDGNACTTEVCDPDNGCEYTDVDCDDGDACTTEVCDPVNGCEYTDVDCDDGDACTTEVCDPVNGCEYTDVDCDDGSACTTEICDPVNGCEYTDVECDDGDECTRDWCDDELGCQSELLPPEDAPDGCYGDPICRTPGFWGARGGDTKGQNVTLAVICGGDPECMADPESYPGLEVCGTNITNTFVGNSNSALEAMCVSVKGDIQRQLVRQLTAATLNCAVGDCTLEVSELVASCSDICASGVGDMNMCIAQLDCFNNGDYWDEDSGQCLEDAGMCEVSGDICYSDDDCEGVGEVCELFSDCHDDTDMCPDFYDDGEINGSDFCFEPLGPASSPKECNAARKNEVYVP